MVMSFGAATDVLTWGRVSKSLHGVRLEEMAGSVLLPTNKKAIVVWNAATGATERYRLPHDEEEDGRDKYDVDSWSIAPDGQTVAMIFFIRYGAERVEIWKPVTGEHVATLDEDYEMAWSPDATLLAGTNGEPTVKLFDATTGECLRLLGSTQRDFSARGVAFSPNSKMLAAEGNDVVVVWDVDTEAILWEFKGHDIQALQFSPDSKRLYSCGGDAIVLVFSCETGSKLFDIKIPGNVDCFHLRLAVSRDGKHLAAFDGGTAFLWDARTGSLLRAIREIFGNEDKGDCAFSPDARRLVVICRDRACFVDTTTGTIIGSLRPADGEEFCGACYFFTTSPFPSSSSSDR